MRTWLIGIGLTLAICSPAYAAPEASEAPFALVTPKGFCVADGSHPADTKVAATFRRWFETAPGGKLLSLYRFCSGAPTTAGLIVVADAGAFEGSAGAYIGQTCEQFKAIKKLTQEEMNQIIGKVDEIAKEELGRPTSVKGIEILSAAMEGEVCYAFIRPEGAANEPVLEILSYVPIRNKILILLRVYGVTGPSATGESYQHLQETIAALKQANP
jgi:hypothetical protein